MSRYVLDNSVTMRWLLTSKKKKDQVYAVAILQSLANAEVVVPNLWHLEVVNVLMAAEKRGELTPAEVERFIAQLEALPIQVDPLTAHQAFSRTLNLTRLYKLSSYDAAYLELAVRENLPLATLDRQLMNAAGKANVSIYLNETL